jgi:hypothetical protein
MPLVGCVFLEACGLPRIPTNQETASPRGPALHRNAFAPSVSLFGLGFFGFWSHVGFNGNGFQLHKRAGVHTISR